MCFGCLLAGSHEVAEGGNKDKGSADSKSCATHTASNAASLQTQQCSCCKQDSEGTRRGPIAQDWIAADLGLRSGVDL